MDQEITALYGKKVRVRVCGLCWEDNKLLLVNHRSLKPVNFWAPPGGGLEFGEKVENALKREFGEETGLEIAVTRFAFGCEYIQDPLHAIELFFHVKRSADPYCRL
jgi:8-oxo-dGTP diphosphatase